MMMRFRSRRGATLAEVATASMVFLLMLGGLVSIGVQASNGWANGTSEVMADDSASSALQAITRDVRNGLRCTVNEAHSEVTVTMPYVNAQGDYDRYNDGSDVKYYVSAGKLYRQAGVSSPTVLSRNVTSIQFVDSGGELQVQITCQRQNGNRSATTVLTTQVGLRNEPV